MSMLPREVLKWLQSLDLTHPVRNTRRDFSNGYLIAEIFSWYYPQEIQMHSFDNGTSIDTKLGNWSIINRFFQQQEFNLPREEIQGTIHCKPVAASLLIQRIYTLLTNRSLALPSPEETDFSDSSYQNQLPYHARSTATQAIKNNIANSEFVTDPDSIVCGQKAQEIIHVHIKNREQQRKEDPKRFGIKPSLCERSPRKAISVDPTEYYDTIKKKGKPNDGDVITEDLAEMSIENEIQVQQHNYKAESNMVAAR